VVVVMGSAKAKKSFSPHGRMQAVDQKVDGLDGWLKFVMLFCM